MIRRLLEADAEAFRALRLEALRLHPEAFLASYDEWRHRPLADFAARLAGSRVFGHFDAEDLSGIAALDPDPGPSTGHRGYVTMVYLRPSARGRGVLAGLLAAIEAEARDLALVQIELHVAAGNLAARRAYRRLGYDEVATLPRVARIGGVYIDDIQMIRRLDGG